MCWHPHCSQVPENSTHPHFILKYQCIAYDLTVLNQMSNSRSHVCAFYTLVSCSLRLYPAPCPVGCHNSETLAKRGKVVSQDVLRRMSAFFSYEKPFDEIIITDVSIILNFWFCVLGSQVNYTNILERHAFKVFYFTGIYFLVFYFTGISPEECGTIFIYIICSVRYMTHLRAKLVTFQDV